MIRWFGYGLSLGLGLFVACAISDRIDQWRRDDEEALGI